MLGDVMKYLNPEEEKRIMEYTISYEKKALEKVAKNMLAKGMDVSLISEVTGLSVGEIEKLKKELQR